MTARMAAAIVLMLGAGTVAGAELGRLFFTPAQRATLDKMRGQNSGMEAAGDKEPAPSVPQNVSLDGVVRRSDGKNTVWLNNRAVSGRQAGGIKVTTGKNDNRVKLTVPESGRSFDLKVGQTAEIVSGTIAESHAPRRAPPPKPEARAAPGAESAASGAAKATPPAASRPAGSARNAAARAREPDAEDGIRPKRVGEAK
jgi:hypothetical protein